MYSELSIHAVYNISIPVYVFFSSQFFKNVFVVLKAQFIVYYKGLKSRLTKKKYFV